MQEREQKKLDCQTVVLMDIILVSRFQVVILSRGRCSLGHFLLKGLSQVVLCQVVGANSLGVLNYAVGYILMPF